jgi:hypothetical protein
MPASLTFATNSTTTVGNSATLQNVGDLLQVFLGNVGVGNPTDQIAIVSLTGTFTAATVAIEAVPQGLPISLTTTPIAPLSANSWIATTDISVVNGQPVSSPVGPLTSAGGVGSGFSFTFNCGQFQLIQLRLVSIGSGAITGGIATGSFPGGSATNLLIGLANGQLLELQRIRVGINLLLASTDQNDNLATAVPTYLGVGN